MKVKRILEAFPEFRIDVTPCIGVIDTEVPDAIEIAKRLNRAVILHFNEWQGEVKPTDKPKNVIRRHNRFMKKHFAELRQKENHAI